MTALPPPDTSPVTFTNPPLKRHGQIDWEQVSESLRANPGQWALIGETISAGIPVAIRQGRIEKMRPENGFEVTTRNNKLKEKPRTCDLYVRYVPDKDTSK